MPTLTTTKKHLYSLALLLSLGTLWAIGYIIARFATTHGVPPLGFTFWQSIGPALLLLLIIKTFKIKIPFNKANLKFFLFCALFGSALPNTNMFYAAAHLPAGLLSMLINISPILIYFFALLFRLEKFHWGRALGVLCAIIGLLLVTIPEAALGSNIALPWALAALISPLCFAATAIYISKRKEQANVLVLAFGMTIIASFLLAPVVFASHNFYAFHWPLNRADQVVILGMFLSVLSSVIIFKLLRVAGAVYYSLVDGVVILVTLFLGWLFFAEKLNYWTGSAAIFILAAIFLVSFWQKKARAE